MSYTPEIEETNPLSTDSGDVPDGSYVYVGERLCIPYIYTGTEWKQCEVYIVSNGEWKITKG